jgi:hypothetical protein
MRSVPGPDVALSLDGQHLAIVTDKKPGEDPEGLADPYIGVATTMGEGQVTEIGPGRSPHWSADAARIAAITDDGIVSYDVGSGASTPVLEGAVWSLFGWSGPEVGAVGLDGASLTTPGSEPRYLDLDPSTVWGISPTDGTVLTIDQATATVIRGEQETDISMEGGLGDGAWDPDGSVIVAVIIGTGTTIGVIDTVTATIRYEAEGVGAQGNVVWSADSKRFAFVRIAPNDRLKLQAVVCTLEGECEPAFSWARGVSLLGFTEI